MPENSWNRASFVLVVPYSPRWRVRRLVDRGGAAGTNKAGPRIPFDLVYRGSSAEGDTSGEDAASALKGYWNIPGRYFTSAKIANAASPDRYAYWLGGAEYVSPSDSGRVTFPSQYGALELIAAECQEYLQPGAASEVEPVAFAVFHLRLPEVTSSSLTDAARSLRRPDARLADILTRCLRMMGIGAEFTKGGFARCALPQKEDAWAAIRSDFGLQSALVPVQQENAAVGFGEQTYRVPHALERLSSDLWEGDLPQRDGAQGYVFSRETWKQRIQLHRNSGRAFILTFVAGERVTEPCELLESHHEWTPVQTWTHQLATGANPDRFFRLPPTSATAAAAQTFEFDATQCRAMPDGLAVVADPVLTTKAWRDGSDIQALLHSRLLDLVLLCLRQRAWLDRHAESLAKLYAAEAGSVDDHTLEQELLRKGGELGRFRNTRWFTEVPAHPEATVLLRTMQDALETPTMLLDAAEEEEELIRGANMRRAAVKERESEERAKLRDRLEKFLAALTVAAVVPSLFALMAEPGWLLFGSGVGVTVVLTVLAFMFADRLWK